MAEPDQWWSVHAMKASMRGRLPAFCFRNRIFLSYASEHRPLAQRIAQALINADHDVFFDENTLEPSTAYDQKIRHAIARCDVFIFLASRQSLTAGRYTLTELQFAKEKWPSPVGHVLPVLIDPEVTGNDLPPYLASVHALQISGNGPSEVCAAVEPMIRLRHGILLGVASLVAASVALTLGIFRSPSGSVHDVRVTAPEYVILRPRAQPPANPSLPDADKTWTRSPVTVTVPVAYSRRAGHAVPVHLEREEVILRIGGSEYRFGWAYVVEILSNSTDSQMCREWLCQKENVGAFSLKPGEASAPRETMFLSAPDTGMAWQDLVDSVLDQAGPQQAEIILRSHLAVSSDRRDILESRCLIDLAGPRKRMSDAGFSQGRDPRPATWQPQCLTPDP